MPTVPSYLKNVAKSFGYAMGETLSSYNPVITSLAKESKEAATEIYQNIKSFSIDGKTIDEKSFKGTIKNTVDDIWNNFKEDIKSGNWYNKQRKSQSDDAMAKALGFDFDWDSEFGDFGLDEDWGDEDTDESTEKLASTITKSDQTSTKQIIESVDAVGYKIAASSIRATTEAADYIVASNNQSSKAIYNLTARGFGSINSALATINNTITAFAKIGEPLSAHMQNAATFYTNTSKTLEEMKQSLHQIEKNSTPAKVAGENRYSSSRNNTLSNIFNMDSGISVDSYISMVKEQFKDNKDMIDMAINAIKGFKSSDPSGRTSFGKNISIMEMATTLMTKVMLPKVFKESMKNFNDQIKYAMGAGLIKFRDSGSSNIIVDLIKDLIVPQDTFKSKINPSNYEKGPVAWDGYSRQALTHVIPTVLLGIYSALSGAPQMAYDYESGKFITKKNIQLEVRKQQMTYAKRAGGDFREAIIDRIRDNKNLQKQDRERLQAEIDEYFYQAFMKGGTDFANVNKSNFDFKKYGLSEESLALIRQIIAEDRDPKAKKGNRHGRFLVENQLQRDSYGEYIRRQESTGMNLQTYLYNGFGPSVPDKNKTPVGVDEYDHSMSFYLQGIYQYTGYLADNIDFIGGSSKKIKKRKALRKRGSVAAIQDANEEAKRKTGEKTKEEANTSNVNSWEQIEDEDILREKEKNERVKDAKSKAKNTLQKILKFGTGKEDEPGTFRYYYNRPFVAVSNLLDRIGLSLDRLIWGDDDNPENGLYGYLFKKGEEFKDWLDKKFKVKENFNKLKVWLFGDDEKEGKLSSLKRETGEQLHKAGRWFGSTVKQFFAKGDRKWRRRKPETAAYGRKVTKSGIVAVSEGELIIPSEFNPFYHGKTNKRQQILNEQRIVDNFYGSFTDGGTVGDTVDYKERAARTKERLKNKYEEFRENEGQGRKFIREGFETLGAGFSKFFHSIFGVNDEKQIQEDNKTIKRVMSKIFKEAGDNKGAMGAGAIIGAGVSVLSGAVVGPLFGAAIGAGAGLVVNSKTVQKILFGNVIDEKTGEVSGGLLSKNVANFLKRNVPDMAKGAALGGAAGLFMGSPVMGAILGGAAGFVKSSDKAKKWIFGDDKSEGLISKALQARIKKALPNMSAGMIAGLLVGPFGTITNLIVGASIGYLTTSEKFHEYMFGNGKDDKGLAGILKEKIFGNLDETFHNLNNAIKGFGKNMISSLSKRIKDFFSKRARAYQDGQPQSLIGRVIGGTITKAGGAVKGITNFVGNRLGGINRRVKGFNLARGYGVYDREKGRNLYAQERVDLRRGRAARSSEANLDRRIAGFQTKEELEAFRDELRDIQDPNRVYKREMNSAAMNLFEGLQDLDPKKANRVRKAIESGKLENLQEILTPEEFASHRSVIQEATTAVERAKNTKNRTRDKIRKFGKQGIDLSKSGKINSALERIDYELGSDRFSPEKQQEQKTETYRDKVIGFFRSIDKNLAIISGGEASEPETAKEAEKEKAKIEEKNKKKNKTAETIKKDSEEDLDKKTIFDMAGNPQVMVRDKQNNWVPATNDSTTDRSRERMNNFFDAISSLPLIGGGVRKMSWFMGNLHDKLFGSKDGEKQGIFSKILGFLGGENGPLNWLTSWLAGTKIGMGAKALKAALGKISIKSVFTNIIAPALLIGGFAGLFDNAAKKITDGAFGEGSDADIHYNENTGEELTLNENGDYVDSQGNIVNPENVKIRSGDVASLSDRLRINVIRQAARGHDSIGSKFARKYGKRIINSKLGKTVKKVGGKAVDLAKKGGKKVSEALAEANFKGKLLDTFSDLVSKLKKIDKLAPVVNYLDDAFAALAEKVTKSAVKKGVSSIGKTIGKIVPILNAVLIVGDFITGYEDARRTLGVFDEPTILERILCGLLRVVKNLVPVVGDFIPDETILDIFCDVLGPIFGVKSTDLQKRRNSADQQLEQYNKEHGTDYTKSEYIKTVMEDYTFVERTGNAIKSTWNEGAQRTKNFWKGVKEQGGGIKGFFGQSKKVLTDQYNVMVEAYQSKDGGLQGTIAAMGAGWEKALPGVAGEIMKKNSDILGLAIEGKLKELWNVSLDDFSGGKQKGDITTAMPSLFSTIIGNIPLIVTKLIGTPIALISKLFGGLKNIISKVVGGLGEFFGGLVDGVKGAVGDAKDWVVDKASGAKDWVVDKASAAKNWIGDKVGGIVDFVTGGGSGQDTFISQLDPKYKKMKFGDSTVGQKGCAPAVASMISKKYGKNLSMQDAVAKSTSYQNENGTSVDYFQKILGEQGIGTTYLKGDNIPGQIVQNLANGQPVILLGKDKNNTSKENSPFGPNGHYVLATGLDKNGNIVINDPESTQPRVYSRDILNKANISISTTASGSGSLDTENARKVWSFFTSNGYSPAATAGILANLQAESGVNPASIQSGGKGPAAGIAQWESWKKQSGRWKQMADYAASQGYQWTELDPQLQFIDKEVAGLGNYFEKSKNIEGYQGESTTVEAFKNATDPQWAAIQFEKAFERAGKPRMAQRVENASTFYKLYHDSEYTGNYTPSAPDPNASVGTMSSGMTEQSTDSSSDFSLTGIIGTIGSAFTSALGKVLLGNDSSSDSNTATTAVESAGNVNYTSSGGANVQLGPAPKGNGNDAQKKIVQYAESRLGKNQYTQDMNLRTQVGNGYSDCSAFAQWVYKNALGIDPGSYTEAQLKSPLLTTVDKGTTPNKDNLEMGDLLFFRSNKNNGRTENVGHVEIYDGNGGVIGHGSGVGPKRHTLDQYIKIREDYGGPYIEARRYSDIAEASGGSSGLLLKARPGTQVYGKNTQFKPVSKKTGKLISGGASSLVTETTNMLQRAKTTATAGAKAGTVSADTVNKLLQAIVDILKLISTNTTPIKDIYTALSSYFGTQSTAQAAVATTAVKDKGSSKESDVDVNIRNLAGTLAAIAKG